MNNSMKNAKQISGVLIERSIYRTYDLLISILILLASVYFPGSIRAQDCDYTIFGAPQKYQVLSQVNYHNNYIQVASPAVTTLSGASSFQYIDNVSLAFEKGELVVRYEFNKSGVKGHNEAGIKVRDWEFEVDVQVFIDDTPLPVMPDQIFGDIGLLAYDKRQQEQKLILTDIVGRYGNLEGLLSIQFTVRYKEFNCMSKPRMTVYEWAGYAMGAAAGVGLIVLSKERNEEALEAYDAHLLVQGDVTYPQEARPKYQEYQELNREANRYLRTGIAILAIDAGIMTYRIIKHSKKKKRHKACCGNRSDGGVSMNDLELDPYFIPQSPASINTRNEIGLSLTYKF